MQWKDRFREAYNEWRRTYRTMIRWTAMWYKTSHPCADCGESNPSVLTFDHVRGQKFYDMSKADSLAGLRQEVQKCDVVCFNCHMKRERCRKPLPLPPVVNYLPKGGTRRWRKVSRLTQRGG